jgi:hypothetical protein
MDHVDEHLQRIYRAEQIWKRQNPEANRSISMSGAADLLGDIIHNPEHEETEGLENLRNLYNSGQVRVYNHLIHGGDPEKVGGFVLPQETEIFLNAPKLTVGNVTHEGSHLLNYALRRGMKNRTNAEHHDAGFAAQHINVAKFALGENAGEHLRALYRALDISV